ncbi:MAG: hypothetical protein AB1546_01445 [bacterium]
MLDVAGYPLEIAEKLIIREGYKVKTVTLIEPPKECIRRHYRRPERTVRFVVSQKLLNDDEVELDVVDCRDI